MTRLATLVFTLALLLVSAACTLHPEDTPLEPDGSVPLAVAETRINQLARDVVHDAVGPAAVLDGSGRTNPISFACSRYSQAPPGSPHVSQYSYAVALPEPSKAQDYLARFEHYLRVRGWQLEPHSTRTDRILRRDNYEIAMTLTGVRSVVVTMGTGCLRLH